MLEGRSVCLSTLILKHIGMTVIKLNFEVHFTPLVHLAVGLTLVSRVAGQCRTLYREEIRGVWR